MSSRQGPNRRGRKRGSSQTGNGSSFQVDEFVCSNKRAKSSNGSNSRDGLEVSTTPNPLSKELSERKESSDLLCPICWDIIDEAYMTCCGHSFCFRCISRSLDNSNRCPKCKYLIERKDMIYPNFVLNEVLRKYRSTSEQSATSALNVSGLNELNMLIDQDKLDIGQINLMLDVLNERKQQLEFESKEVQMRLLDVFLNILRDKKYKEFTKLKQQLETIDSDLVIVQKRLEAECLNNTSRLTVPSTPEPPETPSSSSANCRSVRRTRSSPSASVSTPTAACEDSPIFAAGGGGGCTDSESSETNQKCFVDASSTLPVSLIIDEERHVRESLKHRRTKMERQFHELEDHYFSCHDHPVTTAAAGSSGALQKEPCTPDVAPLSSTTTTSTAATPSNPLSSCSTSSSLNHDNNLNNTPSGSQDWLLLSAGSSNRPFTDLSAGPSPLVQAGSVNAGAGDCLSRFGDCLTKATSFSCLRPLATLTYTNDLYSSSSIVSSIEFDRDCDYFAIAGVQRRIKVFDYHNVIRHVDYHYPEYEMQCQSKISCVAWSAYHRNVLASSDYDGMITVWDVFTGKKSQVFSEHEKRCWSVNFNKMDPKLLASGSDDHRVKIWATDNERSVSQIEAKANVCCVEFSPHSRFHLVFGSADHCVHYYDLRNTKEAVRVFRGHRKAVSYSKFVDASSIISASTDSTLRLWDIESTNSLGSSNSSASSSSALTGAASSNSNAASATTGSTSSSAVIPASSSSSSSSAAALSSSGCSRVYHGHVNEKNFVGLSSDGHYVACGSENNQLYVYYKGLSKNLWHYKFETPKSILDKDVKDDDANEFVSAVCWRPGTNVIMAANSKGIVKVLQLE